MTKLYFVRHGLTDNNKAHRFNGRRSDPSLLSEGKKQAEELGNYLSEKKFSRLYVSPANRALETMEIILGVNQFTLANIEKCSLLREIDFGIWDGTPVETKKDHVQFKNLMKAPDKYDPKKFEGENYFELLKRGQTFIQSLDYDNNEQYLIVGHGVMLTSLLQYLNGKEIHQFREQGLLANASLSIFDSGDGEKFNQNLWNFTDYLNT